MRKLKISTRQLYLVFAFLLPTTTIYAQCVTPKINGSTELCYGESPLFISNLSKINWYTDTLLEPIESGIIFAPTISEPGTHTLFANQEGCQSDFEKVEFTIYEIPDNPDIEDFQNVYTVEEIENETLFEKEYSWYKTTESAEPFFIGKKLPDTLSKGQHNYFIAQEQQCKSEKVSIAFMVVNDEPTITGIIQNNTIVSGKAQLVSENQVVVYQSDLYNNTFTLICEQSGNYYVRIIPFDSEKFLPTYYGNSLRQKSAHVFTVSNSSYSGVDVLLSEQSVSINTDQAHIFYIQEGSKIQIIGGQVKELNLFTIDGRFYLRSTNNSIEIVPNQTSILHVVLQTGDKKVFTVK